MKQGKKEEGFAESNLSLRILSICLNLSRMSLDKAGVILKD